MRHASAHCCLVCAQSDLQLRIEAVDGWDVERRVKVAMDALRCADGSADVYAFAWMGGSCAR